MTDTEKYFSLPEEFRSGVVFRYWWFYDYPRNIRLTLSGQDFYLQSPFLEDEDEFSDFYDVYEFDAEAESRQKRRWRMYPPEDLLRPLGRIPIAAMDFSRDRRSSFALAPLLRLLARSGYTDIWVRTQEYEAEPRARVDRTKWWSVPG